VVFNTEEVITSNILPQPTTPRPLIMVVWESVPTKLSG
jgi:hypothetical protein